MADDWIGAATAQLDRLRDERHYGKMRATIIALVGARLAGKARRLFGSHDAPKLAAGRSTKANGKGSRCLRMC